LAGIKVFRGRKTFSKRNPVAGAVLLNDNKMLKKNSRELYALKKCSVKKKITKVRTTLVMGA
jgi:hypothetical protein